MPESLGGSLSTDWPQAALDQAAKTRVLESAFRKIEEERMRDIPILNPKLRVACIGMRPFEGGWLSALITPWFINLMLLPGNDAETAAWGKLAAGSKVVHHFPAGAFEFICANENGIGPYRMCSLFSPVLEFEDQAAAQAAAEASLTALFDASLNEEAARPPEAQSAPQKVQAAKFSRRDLMFGLTRAADARRP